MKCRHCHAIVEQKLVDFGCAPPSNAYVTVDAIFQPEIYYPLRVMVCTNCWLIQTEDFHRTEELFSADYAYFSSVSSTWLNHAAKYCRMITERLHLHSGSFVIEVAANDGYLLRNFLAAGIPCLGIEPTKSTAVAAEQIGIPILRKFFGATLARSLASDGRKADLIIGNNVYAHVPDINDFTDGLKAALKPGGAITLEFPHALKLIAHTLFDTIYHEHFSYLSLHAVSRIFRCAGLRIFDVERLATHGGSLRIYGCHEDDERQTEPSVLRILDDEIEHGLLNVDTYQAFQRNAERIKDDLLLFLIEKRRAGKTVAAYGAAAKGNTLLNFAGVKTDLLPYVCDAAASKQGKYLPGSRIPILAPQELRARQPDYLLVLPWNIAHEVVIAHGYIRDWGGRFVTAVPDLNELP